ncbi:HNH endonuclease [bacterium DOLZORAL124_64_63]|nr:MAG: HNH endonuclease [bacterium DOLZORAL124_64_63]
MLDGVIMFSGLEIESQIRAKVFEFLSAATDRYGEVLRWDLLTKGFTFQGERVPLLGASGIWKPKVFESIPLSITTAPPKTNKEAPYNDGMDSLGRLAYKYRGTDPGHRDNVGLRLAMQKSIPLVYFFGIDQGLYLPTWPVFVVADDPRNLTFSVSIDDKAMVGHTTTGLASEIRDARRQYVTTVTLRRLHQQKFRSRVIRAYRSRCAVCRLKHSELLDAAHIIPDSDPRGEPIVPNGLALCKIHHAAFDRHILGITPDLKVQIRADILQEVDGPMLKHGLQEMDGTSIVLPSNIELRPRRDLVEARFEEFKRAG